MHVSNVCRLTPDEVAAISPLITEAGKTFIPSAVLAARQVLIGKDIEFVNNVKLKRHRGNLIPTIPRHTAKTLVENGAASWCPQWALTYTMKAYLADNDVLTDTKEFAAASAAFTSGENLVLIGLIGDNRSPLSVCRNIVSGCQIPEKLVADAIGAMEAADIFLVED